MSQIHPSPKIEALRRSKRILDRQIKSRTAELEKANEFLKAEIARRNHIEDELEVENVSAKKQTERVLRESQERYRTLADALPVLVWQAGTDKLCTYFNKGWLEFTGRTMEQELGNGWAEGVHPDDLRRCLDTYVSAFDRREPFTIEYRLRHSSGEYHWILDRGVPQFSSEGSFLGYIGGAIVTHDRKHAEQALRDSEEQLRHTLEALEKSREELRALAAGLQAAHETERAVLAREIHDELSGSLTALKMDLSLLPDRAAKNRHSFLEKLSSMSKLIDRTLARVHTIVTDLRPVVLDKFGLVAAIEWQTAKFQDRSGIACETHLPAEEISLDSDRSTALFRILQEALTNVARHAKATRVIVDMKSEAGHLILAVRDNGKGIDEKATEYHGSMGLLGIRERALAMGGIAEVAALSEGGTLVSVKIPID